MVLQAHPNPHRETAYLEPSSVVAKFDELLSQTSVDSLGSKLEAFRCEIGPFAILEMKADGSFKLILTRDPSSTQLDRRCFAFDSEGNHEPDGSWITRPSDSFFVLGFTAFHERYEGEHPPFSEAYDALSTIRLEDKIIYPQNAVA